MQFPFLYLDDVNISSVIFILKYFKAEKCSAYSTGCRYYLFDASLYLDPSIFERICEYCILVSSLFVMLKKVAG